MDTEMRDVDSPVVIPRRVTPANRPLQHLEAGRLGASTPQHCKLRVGDRRLTHLMSAELLPRLEGGIRAVLDETDDM